MISEGSAFLDRSGRVLAADATFRACLRLPAGDATAALRERAAGDPALAALLGGAGPDSLRATGDPARVARLLLGVFMRALAGTREGGRLLARAAASGPDAVLAIEHERGAPDPLLAW